MKFSNAPYTSNVEFNLRKQAQVTQLCYQDPLDIMVQSALDCQYLSMIHEHAHIDKARAGQNGFGGFDYRKVLHAEASCSSMVTAASSAVSRAYDGKAIAFAPVSGFHHAGPNRMTGFCTFNGLIATAIWAQRTKVGRVLILDGDGHFGDGTQDMIEFHRMESWVTSLHIANPALKDTWMKAVEATIDSYNLVLYQAGADAHVDDPYKAGTLTTGDWIARDRFVFDVCKRHAVPIVWNLAGGYNGGKTLDLHTSTFETACEVFYPDETRKQIKRAAEVFPEYAVPAAPIPLEHAPDPE